MQPPCGECDIKPLPENNEAFRVWEYVQGQVIVTGFGDVIDVDFKGVEIGMEMLGVEDRKGCFLKVVEIGRSVIGFREKKARQPG